MAELHTSQYRVINLYISVYIISVYIIYQTFPRIPNTNVLGTARLSCWVLIFFYFFLGNNFHVKYTCFQKGASSYLSAFRMNVFKLNKTFIHCTGGTGRALLRKFENRPEKRSIKLLYWIDFDIPKIWIFLFLFVKITRWPMVTDHVQHTLKFVGIIIFQIVLEFCRASKQFQKAANMI